MDDNPGQVAAAEHDNPVAAYGVRFAGHQHDIQPRTLLGQPDHALGTADPCPLGKVDRLYGLLAQRQFGHDFES
ncbi:hypothetical protein J5J83_15780 [Azoarcus sp. L1K30]|uniref:hypothetical protein n=1 Tax=Azoarcus sp. L1K30 TaxID=2820277 RepID=UPI001B846148|nr:hypothetical protein [Azoarcus sp. L1K30]MBR0567583.1 hypothetical protein [Azoarcus sp. L1K30]